MSEVRLIEYVPKFYLKKMAMFEPQYMMETKKDKETLFRFIEDAPTIDAVPVVHGHWIKDINSNDMQCSACGNWICYDSAGINIEDYDPIDDLEMYYCNFCGAKMDEKMDEVNE